MPENDDAQQSIWPYMLRPEDGLDALDPDVKASASSTGGALTLIVSRTTGGAPLHVHSREDECFYVLDGSITVQCGEDVYEAGPRSFVFLPRGIPHSWDVTGEGTATVLIMTVPAALDDFLREFHAEGADRREVAQKYGIAFL